MTTLTDDLEHAIKYLDDAQALTRNAGVLLERVAEPLAEDALVASRLLEETRDRARRAADTLASL